MLSVQIHTHTTTTPIMSVPNVKDQVVRHMMDRTSLHKSEQPRDVKVVLPDSLYEGGSTEGTYRPHDVEIEPGDIPGRPRIIKHELELQGSHFGISPFRCEERERRLEEEKREKMALASLKE